MGEASLMSSWLLPHTLIAWADLLCLDPLNRGREFTCVRHNGASIVDVTLGNPAAARKIGNWRVLGGEETLSDHKYIRYDVSDPSMGRLQLPQRGNGKGGDAGPPRWVKKRMDKDLLTAAAIVKVWTGEIARQTTAGEGAETPRGALTEICDIAMPRSRPAPRKTAAYWWSQELAALREECNAARRRLTRCRRRRGDKNTYTGTIVQNMGYGPLKAETHECS